MAPRKSASPRKSAQYYRNNPDAKAKKDAYNKDFNKKPEQRKKRTELSRPAVTVTWTVRVARTCPTPRMGS